MLVPTRQNTKTISDMRKNPVGLLRTAIKDPGPLYIFYRSQPKAVLLSVGEYEQMLDLLSDLSAGWRGQAYEGQAKNKIKWLTEKQLEKSLGEKD